MGKEEDEKKVDDYLARANAPTEKEKPTQKSDEQKVEEKAREAPGPTHTSVLQKRTQLSEAQLENRIGQISAKHVGKIDEGVLRGHIAYHLKQHNNRISEAELIQLQDDLLKASEKEEPTQPDQQPGISPPPFINDSLSAAGNRARAATDWVAAAKTPGGVGFLVFVLLFFIWVVVPVNDANQTRLQLLWGVLTGQVGWNQNIQNQENQWASQAAQQTGIPNLPNLGTGEGTQTLVAAGPFIPSFDE